MSLRQKSIRTYRTLLRAAHTAAANCAPLQNKAGLLEYIGNRFQRAADTHRRRLTMTLGELQQKEQQALQQLSSSAAASSPSSSSSASSGKKRREIARRAAKQRQQILSQYEQFISHEIDQSLELATMLPQAADNPALTSMMQVLAAGVGSPAYQRTMESGFYRYFAFEAKRAARDEVDDEATSEYQNRLMLQAILPYAERLLLLHRTAVGEHNHASPLLYLSPWQMTEAVVGTRSGVTAHHMPLGRDHVLVEIDETYNKQIIYIACTRGANCDTGSYNWFQEVERVEVGESEELRHTVLHAEYLVLAARLCDSLLQETPVHPTRKTVLIGHGVGGALALIVGLLLSQRGYDVSNTISLGSPKALVGSTLERYVAAVNPLRVVLEGDPLVELPVTGADGDPFVHVGEILLLGPSGGAATTGEAVHEGEEEEEHKEDEHAAAAAREDDPMTAEALDDLLSDPLPCSAAPPSREAEAVGITSEDALFTTAEEANSSSSATTTRNTSAGKEEQEEEEDLETVFGPVAARYTAQFLVEDYLRHLSDPSVRLTYAEGDEVWDDGDLAAMRREASAEVHVGESEQRQRDLRGPL